MLAGEGKKMIKQEYMILFISILIWVKWNMLFTNIYKQRCIQFFFRLRKHTLDISFLLLFLSEKFTSVSWIMYKYRLIHFIFVFVFIFVQTYPSVFICTYLYYINERSFLQMLNVITQIEMMLEQYYPDQLLSSGYLS